MKIAARSTWVALSALAVVLASILAFLYVRTQAYDASSYFQNLALLRQMNQLDVRWELDVVKSRMGTETDYNSLVRPLSAFNPLWERLQTAVAAEREPTRQALTRMT